MTLAYVAEDKQRANCCTLLLHRQSKDPFPSWKRASDLGWSQGDSNP